MRRNARDLNDAGGGGCGTLAKLTSESIKWEQSKGGLGTAPIAFNVEWARRV